MAQTRAVWHLRLCSGAAIPKPSPIVCWALRQPRTHVHLRCVAAQDGICAGPSIPQIVAKLRMSQTTCQQQSPGGAQVALCDQLPAIGTRQISDVVIAPAQSGEGGTPSELPSSAVTPFDVNPLLPGRNGAGQDAGPHQTDSRYEDAEMMLGRCKASKFGVIEDVAQVHRVLIDLVRHSDIGLPTVLIHLVPAEKRQCIFSGSEGALAFVLERVLSKPCLEIEVICFDSMSFRFFDGLDQPNLARRIFSRPPDRIPILEPPVTRRPIHSAAELTEVLALASRNLIRHEMGNGRRKLSFIYILYVDSSPMYFVDTPVEPRPVPAPLPHHRGHRINNIAKTLAVCLQARHTCARFVPWRDNPIPRLLSHPITHGRTSVVCTVSEPLGESGLDMLRLALTMIRASPRRPAVKKA